MTQRNHLYVISILRVKNIHFMELIRYNSLKTHNLIKANKNKKSIIFNARLVLFNAN